MPRTKGRKLSPAHSNCCHKVHSLAAVGYKEPYLGNAAPFVPYMVSNADSDIIDRLANILYEVPSLGNKHSSSCKAGAKVSWKSLVAEFIGDTPGNKKAIEAYRCREVHGTLRRYGSGELSNYGGGDFLSITGGPTKLRRLASAGMILDGDKKNGLSIFPALSKDSCMARMENSIEFTRVSDVPSKVQINTAPSTAMSRLPVHPESNHAVSVSAEEPVSCRVAAQTCAGQKCGVKKVNQDAYCFLRTEDRSCLLFGIFDGHGPNGDEVSKFCKAKLPETLQSHSSLLLNPRLAFAEAFQSVDDNLEREAECSVSGTTALMAQIHGRNLTLAWVGDSRAVLGRATGDGLLRAISLTEDHKPELPQERARIEAKSGRVDRITNINGEEIGPYRVWLGVAPILGLAMSRSLGDALAHTVGVVNEPDTTVHELLPADRFLIMASDGVWEWLSPEQAVQIVGSCPSIEAGCKKLMQSARSRWRSVNGGNYIDDITAIVIGFTHR